MTHPVDVCFTSDLLYLNEISVRICVISQTGSASSCNRCLLWRSWICFLLKASNGNSIPLTLTVLTQLYRDKMVTILQTHFLVCFYQLKTLANSYVMGFLAKCARYWYSKNCINTRSFYSWINNIRCTAHASSSAATSWTGFRKKCLLLWNMFHDKYTQLYCSLLIPTILLMWWSFSHHSSLQHWFHDKPNDDMNKRQYYATQHKFYFAVARWSHIKCVFPWHI